MAKLILSLEGSVIREIPLDKERISIGRKAQNDIQIENLAVSGEHACIVTILNDSFLEDLGSTNGTLVNGNPIKKHILQDSGRRHLQRQSHPSRLRPRRRRPTPNRSPPYNCLPGSARAGKSSSPRTSPRSASRACRWR
jgi:pSer/pThr/pTyr-binding forkhead associated (FHA) protein